MHARVRHKDLLGISFVHADSYKNRIQTAAALHPPPCMSALSLQLSHGSAYMTSLRTEQLHALQHSAHTISPCLTAFAMDKLTELVDQTELIELTELVELRELVGLPEPAELAEPVELADFTLAELANFVKLQELTKVAGPAKGGWSQLSALQS